MYGYNRYNRKPRTQVEVNENNPTPPDDNGGNRLVFVPFIILAIVLVALILLITNVSFVQPNEYRMVKQFGKVVSVKDTAGPLLTVPFIQNTESLPKNLILYDMNPSDVTTKDKKSMVLDNYVTWKIIEPLTFYQTINTTSGAENRIDTTVYNSLKNYISSLPQEEVILGRKDGISDELLPGINNSLKSYGIEVISVEIKRLDLPDDNKQSVYKRMISERDQIAASYKAQGEEEAKKIRNDADKQATIIISDAEVTAKQTIAEGESEYMKILAEAYSSPERVEFYEFLRSLDALEASLKGGNKTIILPLDSPLTSLLKDYNG